jgi:3-hydroxybutyryl-CoA dehydrogenase
MKVDHVCVVGAGQMGSGITQVVAAAGFPVIMIDLNQENLDRALDSIQNSLSRMVKKGKLSQDEAENIVGGIKGSTDFENAKDADVLIEAVFEDVDLKRDVFAKLDKICRDDCIFMSNTSQFSITMLASATKRPDRFIGTHWFNPAVIMRLIEVVKGIETSDETLQLTLDFCEKLGKETVVCEKDVKGFITTRFIWAMRMECFRMLDEGLASVEDIDKAIKLSLNHPMGPFELMDFGHLDLSLQVVKSLYETYGERFLPPQALINIVNAGHKGRRSGRGFYRYDEEK